VPRFHLSVRDLARVLEGPAPLPDVRAGDDMILQPILSKTSVHLHPVPTCWRS